MMTYEGARSLRARRGVSAHMHSLPLAVHLHFWSISRASEERRAGVAIKTASIHWLLTSGKSPPACLASTAFSGSCIADTPARFGQYPLSMPMAARCHPSERLNGADGGGGRRHACRNGNSFRNRGRATFLWGSPCLLCPSDPQHRQITGRHTARISGYTCNIWHVYLCYL
jgi:hypothetical protein